MIQFETIKRELSEYDSHRENLIKKSRDVLKLSKQLIYSVHRSELDTAKKLNQDIETAVAELNEIAKNNSKLFFEGSYKIAIQEYVEAAAYLSFVETNDLPSFDGIASNLIVLGLGDLPGELGRRAVFLAGKGEYKEVLKIKDTVDMLYGEMLKLDLRDNESRRKVDAIKYELRKLEDLVLDLKLKGKLE